MSPSAHNQPVTVLDVSQLTYAERVCAATLQGLVNRTSPSIYLDYGIYDDPAARRTNEVFLSDEFWYGKYRALLGNQDQRNLEYYRARYNLPLAPAASLSALIAQHRGTLDGLVVWDEAMPDTVNIAVMLAAHENLLPVTASLAETLSAHGLDVRHDLGGRWSDRVSLYSWAFDTLFQGCEAGRVACIEPGWQRPEFIDYVIQHKIFVYNLSATAGGMGSQLLLLLAFGPPWLRELMFAARLDHLIRKFALAWMGWKSKEVALSNRIQRAVKPLPYPTIFGWHTRHDDELAFMLQLSSNGLRLVPAHLAGNFSFHSKLPAGHPTARPEPVPQPLDPRGVYLSFTLSDGDQLMMMHTGELGNWYSQQRGSVPFNWETQPLLVEIAPALLEKFTSGATENDCLVAGPSGAGYIVPPLAPRLDMYMKDTSRICSQAGIDVVTTYVADPPRRTLRALARHRGHLAGYLAGYAVISRAPAGIVDNVPVIANRVPAVSQIWHTAEDLMQVVREAASLPQPLPAFIGVHLFAYRTAYDDVVKFVESLDMDHVHVVRGDEFLRLFQESIKRKNNGK